MSTSAMTMDLFASNALKTRQTTYHAAKVREKDQWHAPQGKHGTDYFRRSHATTFARSGLYSEKERKAYVRDPITGSWFKDQPEHRREFHNSGSNLTMRCTDPLHEKPQSGGVNGQKYTMWPAPCGNSNSIWRCASPDEPRSFTIDSTGDVSSPKMSRSTSTPSFRATGSRRKSLYGASA